MNIARRTIALTLALAALSAACEPTTGPVTDTPTPAPTAAPSIAASPGASGGQGSPGLPSIPPPSAGVAVVTSAGPITSVTGTGPVLSTPKFALTGNLAMKLSTCTSTGTFPFVWVYTEFNANVGQYVEEVDHIKNLKGNYYLHVVSPPDCTWTVTFSPE